MATISVSTKDTAVLIRRDLKAAFPGTKFSVRTEYFSGGSCIDIRWTDGPGSKPVDAVVDRYRGSGFDGMQDLKYYVDFEDPTDGNTYSYGSHYVSLHHEHTAAYVQPFVDALLALMGDAPRTVEDDQYGHARTDKVFVGIRGDWHHQRYLERRLWDSLTEGVPAKELNG